MATTGAPGRRRRLRARRPAAVRGRPVHDRRPPDGVREEVHDLHASSRRSPACSRAAIVRVSGAKAGVDHSRSSPPNRPSGKFRVELEITEDLHPLVRTRLDRVDRDRRAGRRQLSRRRDAAPTPPRRRARRDDSQQGAVRDRRSDAADGRHDREGNETIDDMKGDVQRAVVVGRRHRRQRERAAHRRQRRREDDGGQRRAALRRCRADRRDDPQGRRAPSASW